MFKSILIVSIMLISSLVQADSVELQKMKQMLSQMDNPPASMLQMVKDLEKAEKRSNKGKRVKSKSLSEFSCKDNIAGVYKSSNGNQIVTINSRGTGSFVQYTYDAKYKDYHGYKGEVDFDWSTTKTTMRFNYTSKMRTTQKETGRVKAKKIKSGTVSCEFAGSYIDIGGVMYYR
ncbi:hypothetical protein [Sulfurimonas sp.]|uniref:hypothetical protein n=1 Tax=Sulfurimonas sp. TaxID=2022749 RepID=UPI002AB24E4C|nr:hypothetical protein [Sulfurimonas sp.]